MRGIDGSVLLLGLMALAAGPASAQMRGTVRVTATVMDVRESEAGLHLARRLVELEFAGTRQPTASSRRETPHGTVTLRPAPCEIEDCCPAAVVTISYW